MKTMDCIMNYRINTTHGNYGTNNRNKSLKT